MINPNLPNCSKDPELHVSSPTQKQLHTCLKSATCLIAYAKKKKNNNAKEKDNNNNNDAKGREGKQSS